VASGPFSGPLHLRRFKPPRWPLPSRTHDPLAVDVAAARPETRQREGVDFGERRRRRVWQPGLSAGLTATRKYNNSLCALAANAGRGARGLPHDIARERVERPSAPARIDAEQGRRGQAEAPTAARWPKLRPLPSPGITRLQRYYEPLRQPSAPGLSLTGVRLIFLITRRGFPCCVRFPCVHAAATTPVQQMGYSSLNLAPPVSAFPDSTVGSACTLAPSPNS
jgi:hypothetical protein